MIPQDSRMLGEWEMHIDVSHRCLKDAAHCMSSLCSIDIGHEINHAEKLHRAAVQDLPSQRLRWWQLNEPRRNLHSRVHDLQTRKATLRPLAVPERDLRRPIRRPDDP